MKIFKPLFLFFAAALMTAACVKESKDGDSILTAGDGIPYFSASGPDGTISSGNFHQRGGIIVLFASYCPTCQSVMPEIEKIWAASEEGTLFVVAPLSRLDGSETETGVASYWEEHGYSMPYYLDVAGDTYYKFAKKWIPRIYVIDKQAKITFMSVSDSNIKAEKIASEIEKALGIEIDL